MKYKKPKRAHYITIGVGKEKRETNSHILKFNNDMLTDEAKWNKVHWALIRVGPCNVSARTTPEYLAERDKDVGV